MFIQRLITALVLAPLILSAILYAPLWVLKGIGLLIIAWCSMEWWQLIPIQSWALKVSYTGLVFLALILCKSLFWLWLPFGLIIWLAISITIVRFPLSQVYWGHQSVIAALGLIVIPLFGQCLNYLLLIDPYRTILIYLLLLIWLSDIGAYIAGKQIGKNKLIPSVSPGKTWEGAISGIIAALVGAVLMYFTSHNIGSLHLLWWLIIVGVTAVISIVGDLFISMLKRRCAIKDTGAILPGHGGILDRLDSLIAAAPWFYFGWSYLLLAL